MQSRNVTQITPAKFLQVTGIGVNRNNLQPRIIKIEGYCANASNGVWLQWHDSTGLPTGGVTPMWETQLSPQNGYTFNYAESPLTFPNEDYGQLTKGLVVAVSTTQGTFTAAATDATGATYNVEVQEWEYKLPAQSVAGDTTTACHSLQVWADNGTPQNKICRIIASNTSNVDLWVFLFGVLLGAGTPSANQIPTLQWKIPKHTTLTILADFGEDGYMPFVEDETTTPPTLYYGCYLWQSTTGQGWTGPGADALTLEATYIAFTQ